MEYLDSIEEDVALFYEGNDVEWTYIVDGDRVYTVSEVRDLVERYIALAADAGISPVFSLGFEDSMDSAYTWFGYLRMQQFEVGEDVYYFPHLLLEEEDAIFLARRMGLPTPLEE